MSFSACQSPWAAGEEVISLSLAVTEQFDSFYLVILEWQHSLRDHQCDCFDVAWLISWGEKWDCEKVNALCFDRRISSLLSWNGESIVSLWVDVWQHFVEMVDISRLQISLVLNHFNAQQAHKNSRCPTAFALGCGLVFFFVLFLYGAFHVNSDLEKMSLWGFSTWQVFCI